MAQIKKRPERMCVACREMKDKRNLIRLVRTPEGEIRIDDSGNGRRLACTGIPVDHQYVRIIPTYKRRDIL